MVIAHVVSLTLALIVLSLTPNAQVESPLVLRVEQKIRSEEPGWRYIRAIQSGRVPIVPSERTLVASLWERRLKGGKRESVSVDIYEVESPEEAAKRLSHLGKGQVAPGWQVSRYEVGDEAYLSEFQNGRRYSIHFRRRNTVADVSGTSLSSVKRFTQHVISQMPAS